MAYQLGHSMISAELKRTLRVLLIEDEFNTVRGTARAIGYRVASMDKTGSISGANKYIVSKKYDLIIVDVRLPYNEGEEVIQEAGLDFINDLQSGKYGECNKESNFIIITAQHKSLRLDLFETNSLCKGVFGKLEHLRVLKVIDKLQNNK